MKPIDNASHIATLKKAVTKDSYPSSKAQVGSVEEPLPYFGCSEKPKHQDNPCRETSKKRKADDITPSPADNASKQLAEIKVMSWNLQNLGGFRRDDSEIAQIAQIINNNNPDILVIQEVLEKPREANIETLLENLKNILLIRVTRKTSLSDKASITAINTFNNEVNGLTRETLTQEKLKELAQKHNKSDETRELYKLVKKILKNIESEFANNNSSAEIENSSSSKKRLIIEGIDEIKDVKIIEKANIIKLKDQIALKNPSEDYLDYLNKIRYEPYAAKSILNAGTKELRRIYREIESQNPGMYQLIKPINDAFTNGETYGIIYKKDKFSEHEVYTKLPKLSKSQKNINGFKSREFRKFTFRLNDATRTPINIIAGHAPFRDDKARSNVLKYLNDYAEKVMNMEGITILAADLNLKSKDEIMSVIDIERRAAEIAGELNHNFTAIPTTIANTKESYYDYILIIAAKQVRYDKKITIHGSQLSRDLGIEINSREAKKRKTISDHYPIIRHLFINVSSMI